MHKTMKKQDRYYGITPNIAPKSCSHSMILHFLMKKRDMHPFAKIKHAKLNISSAKTEFFWSKINNVGNFEKLVPVNFFCQCWEISTCGKLWCTRSTFHQTSSPLFLFFLYRLFPRAGSAGAPKFWTTEYWRSGGEPRGATYRFRLGRLKNSAVRRLAEGSPARPPPRRWRGDGLTGFAPERDEKGSAGNGLLLLYRSTYGWRAPVRPTTVCEAVQSPNNPPPHAHAACQSGKVPIQAVMVHQPLFQKTETPSPRPRYPTRCRRAGAQSRSPGPAGRDACPTDRTEWRSWFALGALRVHQTSPCKTMTYYSSPEVPVRKSGLPIGTVRSYVNFLRSKQG